MVVPRVVVLFESDSNTRSSKVVPTQRNPARHSLCEPGVAAVLCVGMSSEI